MNQSGMNLTFLLFFILCFAITNFRDVKALGCPSGCTCQQRTVRCLRQQLMQIPTEIPPDTNIVDLRYNRIKEVASNAFKGLNHLHTIFLNENQLHTLHSEAFNELPALKYLYLNENRIQHVAADAFKGLQSLQSLYLQSNNISYIARETFSNMAKLERLFLYSNQIVNLPVGSLENLPALKRLRLDSNVLKCDCSMMWFIKMLKIHQNTLLVAASCDSPKEMEGKNLNSIYLNDLHCEKPHLIDEPKDVEISFGGTAVFVCRAQGNPQPEIKWMLNSNEISMTDDRLTILPDGSLRIDSTNANDIGHYECMAKNEMGETMSRPARMTLYEDDNGADEENSHSQQQSEQSDDQSGSPRFIQTPQDSIIASDQDIVLQCTASGTPQPQIIWFFNNDAITQNTERLHIFPNGSLVVENPLIEDTGLYKCEASNYLGSVSSIANVQVNEPPAIVRQPEDQSGQIGSHVTFHCEAEGSPAPQLQWKKDDRILQATNRFSFSVENTKLRIEHLKESDAGFYKCVAENAEGVDEHQAELKIVGSFGPPTFVYEPYDLDTLPGATIELPCKGEGEPSPETKWKKDGRTLINSPKFRFSATGSLFISNTTEQDSGRYECSLFNAYGRVTASGVLAVKKNEELAPGDRFVRIAFGEATSEVDTAINQTVAELFSMNPLKPRHHGDLFRIVRFPTGPAREVARAAEIYERTLFHIRKHVQSGNILATNMTEFNYTDLLSPKYTDLLAQLSGCMAHRVVPNCTDMCYHNKYRSLDGTCNNFENPAWGSSLTGFRRVLAPIYENLFSMPIGWNKTKKYHGFPKPSARLVSTSMIKTDKITPDESITHMVMQWGQFLDHDLDHALPAVSSESWDGVDCKKTCDFAPPCYPIEVPTGDPRVSNRRCLDFIRSSAICGSGMTSVFFGTIQPREQINQLTSFIDASQVYGFSEQFAMDLRNLTSEEGLLREGLHFPNQKSMLPFAAPTDGIDCRRNLVETNVNCFVAGDIRVNEQIGLTAMHTLWLREHNRMAAKLKELNPHWDGDYLYHETRKIIGAVFQHITYTNWLPLIIGSEGMELLGHYSGYDSTVNPSISNVFATAALRFGHSLINPVLHRLDSNFDPIPQGHLPLHKAFFAPWRVVYEGGIDPLLRGLFTVPAKMKMPEENLNSDLTEKLFEVAHAVALDLAAINIQRSRDHAIPGYNEFRKECNMKSAETFDDLKMEISNENVRNKLKEVYGHPGNIDVWVGGILEDVVPGARVGPLFRCLLVEQFKRLRDGDRFWYENPTVFKPEQLAQIKQASMSRVLCDNGDNITRVTKDVFLLPGLQGGYKSCSKIPGLTLMFWQDCSECRRCGSRLALPLVPRQRRSIRRRRDLESFGNDSISRMHVLENNYIDEDMNEERIEGLEGMIENFEKALRQLRRKVHKLEQSCDAKKNTNSNHNKDNNNHEENVNVNNNSMKKPHGHCVDLKGIKRLNNEIWMRDDCTECKCQHHQITCSTEKCPVVKCDKNLVLKKMPNKCCLICVDDTLSKSAAPSAMPPPTPA